MEIQIEMAAVVKAMQTLFPNEYKICEQQVHIAKLDEMLEERIRQETADASFD